MFKRIKKEYYVIFLIVIMFATMSVLSFTSISQLQGNARVVNYVGIVRGATQKLVKKELMGNPDDPLIERLDSIIANLISGEGSNDLIVLEDGEYLSNMSQVQTHWAEIKELIAGVRNGEDPEALYASSEDYFELVDRTVSSAEAYSETQVSRTRVWLIAVNGVFVLILLIGIGYYIRTASIKRRADALGKIAYTDPLTQMPNRAHCEREIKRLIDNPPEEDIAVLMFDMNNLKLVNDHLGHQGGDRIIADFARIIRNGAEGYGLVCRYGGDEFLAIFEDATEAKVKEYLQAIDKKIEAYNNLHKNELEKLSYAVGYVVENLEHAAIHVLIDEADSRMYVRKRLMKEH